MNGSSTMRDKMDMSGTEGVGISVTAKQHRWMRDKKEAATPAFLCWSTTVALSVLGREGACLPLTRSQCHPKRQQKS